MDNSLFVNSIVVTGGGTGGHYFPAIALAESLNIRYPKRNIIYIGSKYGIESCLAPKHVWPYLLLDVEGVLGRSIVNSTKSIYRLLVAYYSLKNIWLQYRPSAVIGTGGYGAAPALLVANSLQIPFFLHESNAKPGLVVKILANKATSVWCGMSETNMFLKKANCILTGTPVRTAFLRSFKHMCVSSKFNLLVLGGSGGASAINSTMLNIAPILLDQFPNLQILHQVGHRDFKDMKVHIHPRYTIVPFLNNMDIAMEKSNLIITRSGASTCAELKACGRPAIMIPMPNSAGNHQVKNAQAMVKEKRAIMLQQNTHLSNNLLDQVSNLINNSDQLFNLSHFETNMAIKFCLDDICSRLS